MKNSEGFAKKKKIKFPVNGDLFQRLQVAFETKYNHSLITQRQDEAQTKVVNH